MIVLSVYVHTNVPQQVLFLESYYFDLMNKQKSLKSHMLVYSLHDVQTNPVSCTLSLSHSLALALSRGRASRDIYPPQTPLTEKTGPKDNAFSCVFVVWYVHNIIYPDGLPIQLEPTRAAAMMVKHGWEGLALAALVMGMIMFFSVRAGDEVDVRIVGTIEVRGKAGRSLSALCSLHSHVSSTTLFLPRRSAQTFASAVADADQGKTVRERVT